MLGCSEFTGVSRVMNGAITMNPWKSDGLAAALHAALTMTREERDARHRANMKWILDNTTTAWARRVLQDLKATWQTSRSKRSGVGGMFGHAGTATLENKHLTVRGGCVCPVS